MKLAPSITDLDREFAAKRKQRDFVNTHPGFRNERDYALAIDAEEEITAADLERVFGQAVRSYPACKSPTSACRGGRRICPTPESCRLPEASLPTPPFRVFLCLLAVALLAAALILR